MRFYRQEYWNGLPFPPPVNLPDSGTELISLAPPALQKDYLQLHHLSLLYTNLNVKYILFSLILKYCSTS